MPYEFTREDFSRFSEDILKAEGDQATITSLLADMQGTVVEAIVKDIANTKTVETVTAENERLRSANMELFFRVGTSYDDTLKQQPQPEEPKKQTTKGYMESYFEKLEEK